MNTFLITGGLNQIGMGLAQHLSDARQQVTIVSSSDLDTYPWAARDLIKEWGVQFVSLNIFKRDNEEALIKLAAAHTHWINTSELSVFEEEIQQKDYEWLYQVASTAGYLRGNEQGKKFTRIALNHPELMLRDGRSFWDYYNVSGSAPRTKEWNGQLAEVASHAIEEYDLALVSACPTLICGTFGLHGVVHEFWLDLIKQIHLFQTIYTINEVNILPLSKAVEGILLIAKSGTPGAIYQVTGFNVRGGEYIGELAKKLNRRLPVPFPIPVFIPSLRPAIAISGMESNFLWQSGRPTPWFLNPNLYSLLESSGARRPDGKLQELGYLQANHQDLDEATGEMINWYKEMGYIN